MFLFDDLLDLYCHSVLEPGVAQTTELDYVWCHKITKPAARPEPQHFIRRTHGSIVFPSQLDATEVRIYL